MGSASEAATTNCPVCHALPPDATEPLAIPPEALRDDLEVLDRITGALLGVAIGDGIGEQSRHGHIMESWPIPDAGSVWVGGATQTTLFTLEGTIRMLVRLHIKGIGPGFQVLRHALDRWLYTQHPSNADLVKRRWAGGSEQWPDGWLVRQHVLHHRRTRMATTANALNLNREVQLLDDHTLQEAPNSSEGAGGLVRVGPAGSLVSPHFAFELGVRIAAQTHGSPNAFLPAGAVSRIVGGLVAGESLEVAVDEADRELAGWPSSELTREAMRGRTDLGLSPRSALGAFNQAFRRIADGDHRNVVGLIADTAWHGGTAPAAVCGLILGAERGASAFAAGWREAPEAAVPIGELALAASLVHRKFVRGRAIPGLERDIGPDDGCYLDQVLWPRYPGW